MMISAVIVGLVIAIMLGLVVRSLAGRTPSARRSVAPKRVRKPAPPARNLHLVVNKNDMDRELAALLGQERARPSDPEAR
jgi:hypothetical protein